jgi:hypothetical protein
VHYLDLDVWGFSSNLHDDTLLRFHNFEDSFCFIGNFDDTFCSLVVLLMHYAVQKISMMNFFAVILDDALFC